ncbi:hypothetical protein CRENBAI_013772, partial [Crenichthys baileyi]
SFVNNECTIVRTGDLYKPETVHHGTLASALEQEHDILLLTRTAQDLQIPECSEPASCWKEKTSVRRGPIGANVRYVQIHSNELKTRWTHVKTRDRDNPKKKERGDRKKEE